MYRISITESMQATRAGRLLYDASTPGEGKHIKVATLSFEKEQRF